MQETKQASIAFSGNIPRYYDAHLGPMFFEPYAMDMANRIGKLAPKKILELASGTGRLTKLLPAVAAKDASIIASDINPAMVNYAQQVHRDERIMWLEIDAVSLPFTDHFFDCVVVQFGVMFYSDRARAFREAWRVLKPGGTFLFNCWDEVAHNPMPSITNETLQHFFPTDTPAFYQVPFSYYDKSTITANLKEAGFTDIAIELVKLTGFSMSAADAAKGLIQGTPTITAIEERDASKTPLIMDMLERKIADRFGKEGIQVPLQAYVVSCKKGE